MGYFPFPLGLNPVHPPFLFLLGLFWLVTADIRYTICCVITSYNGSELAPFTCESVSVPTTVTLALIFGHTTSKCLCFSFPQSHHHLTVLGIWLVIQISENISEAGLEPLKQVIFQMPVTIFLSHGVKMLLFYCLKSPF